MRSLVAGDRPLVEKILETVGNFNRGEIECALELVDVYLGGAQKDYIIIVAEDSQARVCGYACWGPTPLTRGTYDLYWIATRPDVQGKGVGRALMARVEAAVVNEGGRLLVIETSAKESYGNTVGFYRRLGYQEISRIRDFYDAGDDKLIFVKRFSR